MPSPPPLRLLEPSARQAERARRRRKRRGRFGLVGIVVAIIVAVVAIADTGNGGSRPTLSSNAALRRVETTTATTPSATPKTATVPTDPLATKQMTKLIASRQGKVTAAVEDLNTGTEWIINRGDRDQTASIVKANILELLLYDAQQKNQPLSEDTAETAQGMIEASDNDDATDLWDDIGETPAIDAFDKKLGMTMTAGASNDAWGETLTSAADQIKLLQQLAVPKGSVLNAKSIAYQLGLMKSIDPGENWGVTGGVPTSGVSVALKNGWVPLTSGTDWEVNSIGWVKGDKHNYLIAVLTAHDPSEDYGINTIDAMSKIVYDTIGPKPAAGTKTITVTPSG